MPVTCCAVVAELVKVQFRQDLLQGAAGDAREQGGSGGGAGSDGGAERSGGSINLEQPGLRELLGCVHAVHACACWAARMRVLATAKLLTDVRCMHACCCCYIMHRLQAAAQQPQDAGTAGRQGSCRGRRAC